MRVERTSPHTGKVNVMDIDVTHEQLEDWKNEQLIQVAMPNLTASEREFIMTGYTDEDWAAMFGSDE